MSLCLACMAPAELQRANALTGNCFLIGAWAMPLVSSAADRFCRCQWRLPAWRGRLRSFCQADHSLGNGTSFLLPEDCRGSLFCYERSHLQSSQIQASSSSLDQRNGSDTGIASHASLVADSASSYLKGDEFFLSFPAEDGARSRGTLRDASSQNHRSPLNDLNAGPPVSALG